MKRFNAWFTLPSALNEARTLYIHCLKKGRKVNAQVKGQESLADYYAVSEPQVHIFKTTDTR